MPKPPARPDPAFAFEILPARDLNPRAGVCLVIAGPPGTGKSTLLGQMCEEGPALLIATLAREASSWKYQEYNPDTILVEDRQWKPEPPDENGNPRGSYVATAYNQIVDILESLATDELRAANGKPYRVVLLDSGTEAGEAAWHESLVPFGVLDPAYMDEGNRFRPYTALDGLMDRLVKAVQALKTAPTPKHIGISWHIQPAKDDTTERVGDKQSGYMKKKLSADHASEGIEYEGTILPMVRGRFRRRLFGLVDAFIWTDIQFGGTKDAKTGRTDKKPHYVIQVVSDEERHCKIPGPVPDRKYITNSWRELKQLLITPEKARRAS